nr:hypothetical protein [uncultured Desulfobulbus sp.]
MPVIWPDTLPAPLRSGLKITPNPDVKARTTQSGRKEIRRWGKGKGDALSCTLRLWNNHPDHGDQVVAFKRFWDRELNFGLNWIDADWLETGLGYSGYFLRIIGYSPRQGHGTLYSDYAVSFEIKPAAAAWEDTQWLSSASGVAPETTLISHWKGVSGTDGLTDMLPGGSPEIGMVNASNNSPTYGDGYIYLRITSGSFTKRIRFGYTTLASLGLTSEDSYYLFLKCNPSNPSALVVGGYTSPIVTTAVYAGLGVSYILNEGYEDLCGFYTASKTGKSVYIYELRIYLGEMDQSEIDAIVAEMEA